MVLVALLVGFRPEASFLEWLTILGLLLLFAFAFSWISAIIGLVSKSVEAVQWIGFVAVFPLTFASAAFVPTATMPTGLRVFAENQPVTHVIEAIRALMVGTPVGDHAWITAVWCVGIIVVSIPLAGHLFRTRTSK
jgi:ABC-2 type transport system permease protein